MKVQCIVRERASNKRNLKTRTIKLQKGIRNQVEPGTPSGQKVAYVKISDQS